MKQRDLFYEEIEQQQSERLQASRQYRTLEVIAVFNDEGYADGWHFAVSKAFKDQLDIKLMERMEPVKEKNGKLVYVEVKDKEGNIKRKKDGTCQMILAGLF